MKQTRRSIKMVEIFLNGDISHFSMTVPRTSFVYNYYFKILKQKFTIIIYVEITARLQKTCPVNRRHNIFDLINYH